MGLITSLLLLLLVGVTVSTVVDLQKRISGGKTCDNNERPYHVKFTYPSGKLLCGGSLIHPQWILTAEHCYEPKMKAVLGVHPGPPKDTLEITATPVRYQKDNLLHDIMLLKLPKAINDIQPVALPDCNNRPKNGAEVQIAGHATVSGESKTLECAKINVADCPEGFVAHNHMICGETPGKGILAGDCGGGVVKKTDKKADMIYGVNVQGSGEPGVGPSMFMDVCAYMGWINDTINKSG